MRHLEGTHGVGGNGLLKGSRLIHLRSQIHRQDWRSPFNFHLGVFGFSLCFVIFILLICFLS
ncbi:catalase-peroxidase [Gossypium arboreum]|uniref:Catalase-peroxidase n=1 Tax=Gossypium arboreum TaxID=29729 RepID=A0A0B0MHK3_GOSAR|nr:catalase-peroxidase [Gossypium arboreum]